jgi:hypothetical protein
MILLGVILASVGAFLLGGATATYEVSPALSNDDSSVLARFAVLVTALWAIGFGLIAYGAFNC